METIKVGTIECVPIGLATLCSPETAPRYFVRSGKKLLGFYSDHEALDHVRHKGEACVLKLKKDKLVVYHKGGRPHGERASQLETCNSPSRSLPKFGHSRKELMMAGHRTESRHVDRFNAEPFEPEFMNVRAEADYKLSKLKEKKFDRPQGPTIFEMVFLLKKKGGTRK